LAKGDPIMALRSLVAKHTYLYRQLEDQKQTRNLLPRLYAIKQVRRFCKDHQELLVLEATPRKVLDAAKLCEDPMIFYSVFRFFERAAPLASSLIQGILSYLFS
uniref:PORR domain-containing protein n=1 Tax=Hydatigena taeniaeformis TaxID=6205 RepID=A0A0R3WVY4_HYDTA